MILIILMILIISPQAFNKVPIIALHLAKNRLNRVNRRAANSPGTRAPPLGRWVEVGAAAIVSRASPGRGRATVGVNLNLVTPASHR